MSERTVRYLRVASLSALLLLASLPLAAAVGSALGPSGATPGPSGSGLTLSGTPTSGVAPLVVSLRVTGPNGTVPPTVEWAFGDGEYLNGSGASFAAVSHEYDAPGSFPCRVTAIYAYGDLNATLPIDVRASTLNVTISATPRNGTVPLTVRFNATPTGGSGTYVQELWQFGDNATGTGAGLVYTYGVPGNFTANFSVTDSTNHTARATVTIEVANNTTASTKPPPDNSTRTSGSSAPWTDIAVGVAVAALAAFVGVVAWTRVSRREIESTGGEATDASPGPEPLGEEASGSNPEAPAESPGPPPPHRGFPGAQRLTFQILRHLASLPRLGPGDLPTPEWTQAGIAAAVEADQSAVSRILRRLAATGVVTVETTHVAGGTRRLRVYRLTDRGERLGRALREAEPPPVD